MKSLIKVLFLASLLLLAPACADTGPVAPDNTFEAAPALKSIGPAVDVEFIPPMLALGEGFVTYLVVPDEDAQVVLPVATPRHVTEATPLEHGVWFYDAKTDEVNRRCYDFVALGFTLDLRTQSCVRVTAGHPTWIVAHQAVADAVLDSKWYDSRRLPVATALEGIISERVGWMDIDHYYIRDRHLPGIFRIAVNGTDALEPAMLLDLGGTTLLALPHNHRAAIELAYVPYRGEVLRLRLTDLAGGGGAHYGYTVNLTAVEPDAERVSMPFDTVANVEAGRLAWYTTNIPPKGVLLVWATTDRADREPVLHPWDGDTPDWGIVVDGTATGKRDVRFAVGEKFYRDADVRVRGVLIFAEKPAVKPEVRALDANAEFILKHGAAIDYAIEANELAVPDHFHPGFAP